MNIAVVKPQFDSEPSSSHPVPLTGVGGEFELPADQRRIMIYMSDGRLLLSAAHKFNIQVDSFIQRMRKLRRPVNTELADLETIHAAYINAKMANSESGIKPKSESAIIAFSERVMEQAVKERASDIHIRVEKTSSRIYYRIHGDLILKHQELPETGERLANVLYTSLADVSDTNLKIKERQDARISDPSKLPEGLYSIRIATSPTVDGMLMVERLLYNDAGSSTDVRTLGWGDNHALQLDFIKARPFGLNIISGPTGSGKSTTLQRVLMAINEECGGTKHIITVEDPPEYPIPGVVQTPVTNADTPEKRSVQFQNAIRGAMRLDPDIIMIGEIRDADSASLAIQAAMTGHQVWATLHANNAMGVFDRLLDLGVPLSLLADFNNVTGLFSQRLIKTLCPSCKVSLVDHLRHKDHNFNDKLLGRLTRLGDISTIYVQGTGCDECNKKGISGRTAIAEVIVSDPTFMDYMRVGNKKDAYHYWRTEQKSGSLITHANQKVFEGLVDPRMAESVVGNLNFDEMIRDHRLSDSEVRHGT